jgi:hypothetical protein
MRSATPMPISRSTKPHRRSAEPLFQGSLRSLHCLWPSRYQAQQQDAPEFLPIEYELPREDSRRDHWRRRNRSQQQVSRVLMSKGITLIAPQLRGHYPLARRRQKPCQGGKGDPERTEKCELEVMSVSLRCRPSVT